MPSREGDLSIVRERELYFKTMAEALPEIIWTATPDGQDDYFNQKCFDYTGLTFEQLRGTAWTAIVHPDDQEDCARKWQNALRVGEPYEVEYRLRGKDGSYRWFLGRGNPVRNSGREIVKWFGTCTDIENQKQNQQILEKQILERTTQLAEANTHLQEEMIEKDCARNELDRQNERIFEETIGAGHHAGEDGGTAAKLRQPGRSIRGGLGFCSADISRGAGSGGAAECGTKPGGSDRLME
jgi:PAS domain S-box-containing protein